MYWWMGNIILKRSLISSGTLSRSYFTEVRRRGTEFREEVSKTKSCHPGPDPGSVQSPLSTLKSQLLQLTGEYKMVQAPSKTVHASDKNCARL